MARQVKIDCFAYLLHSLIQVTQHTTADPQRVRSGQVGGIAGELVKIVLGGERAVEKAPILYCTRVVPINRGLY